MYSEWKEIREEEHDAFIKTQPICNLLQSSAWACVKNSWQHQCIGMFDDKGKQVASALLLIQKLPLKLAMLYIPRGPIMDYEDVELVRHAFKELKCYAASLHCFTITLDPGILHKIYYKNEVKEDFSEANDAMIKLFASCGVHHLGYTMDLSSTIQPRFHSGVEISSDFEARFPKHTKRHIKKAEKSGVVIEHGSYDLLDDFAALMQKTEERKNIHLRNNDYFKKILDAYGEDGGICIAYLDVKGSLAQCDEEIAKNEAKINKNEETMNKLEKLFQKKAELEEMMQNAGEKIPCAAALYVKFHKTTEMLYMGMDYTYHNYMPAFISHVEAMRWSLAHDCEFCNMGGIEPHMDGGLFKFKNNFDPVIYEYVGEFACPIRKFTYRMFTIANRLRIALKKKRSGTH